MDNDLEKIKIVYDYAKFHIGLYTGVVAASIGIGKLGGDEFMANIPALKVPAAIGIACVVVAGICGAMVAVHVPQYLDLKYDQFMKQRLKAAFVIQMPVKDWLSLEHKSFWGGLFIILGVGAFAMLKS